MLFAWMIFAIKFHPMEKIINNAVLIERSTAREYLYYGNLVLILLVIFNGLYLIEFIYTKIILKIMKFLK